MTKEEAMLRLKKGRRDVDEDYTTAAFNIQAFFKLDTRQMNEMPVSTFRILLEEMYKQYKNSEREAKKCQTGYKSLPR